MKYKEVCKLKIWNNPALRNKSFISVKNYSVAILHKLPIAEMNFIGRIDLGVSLEQHRSQIYGWLVCMGDCWYSVNTLAWRRAVERERSRCNSMVINYISKSSPFNLASVAEFQWIHTLSFSTAFVVHIAQNIHI